MSAILMHRLRNRQNHVLVFAGTGEGPFIARALLDSGYQLSIGCGVKGQYAAAKPQHDLAEGRANAAGTDHANGFSVQVKPKQPFQRKVVLADAVVDAVDLAVQPQYQRHCMFGYALAFNRDLSPWDTGAVTDMSGMFYDATDFNQDLSRWDVSQVQSNQGMFDGANAMELTNQPCTQGGTDAGIFLNWRPC